MSNTHEKILGAAKDLFSTKGYAATTTKEIAAKAGTSEVTLFRHFTSKRNLFQSVLHNTMEDDSLLNFFENELEYNLDKDLKSLAQHFYILYKENGSLMKMLMKDKESNKASEITRPKDERKIINYSDDYFNKMYDMGMIADDPIMCRKFFFSNAIGFLMRKFVFSHCEEGKEYYDWMIDKTIKAIKNK